MLKIPGVGDFVAAQIKEEEALKRAEKEIAFIRKNGIKPLFFASKEYPERLKHCMDSPVLLYTKGRANLNPEKVISVVGTRNATDYGKSVCERIIEGLKDLDVFIVSGLAYGIDITAHKAALKNGLKTAAVLAHGLDKIYPSLHRKTADEMLENGALLTEFISGTQPDRENFPQRNRIIAGMADATIVVEAGKKGGALITAELANSYNRDVFAVPGNVGEKHSEGCNWLISRNKAALITCAEELIYMMGWEPVEKTGKKPVQKQLFVELTPEQKTLVDLLNENGQMGIDTICLKTAMSMSKAAAILLDLEFSGIVAVLPGKVYRLN